jgi:CBS domain-containing protein
MLDSHLLSTLRARDFMQTDILTVSMETSILDVHRMFIEEEIHGAPVVDDDGAVRGVVSTLDLLRAVSDDAEPARSAYFHVERWSVPEQLPERTGELVAADIMTRELVSVLPDMPIAEVAHTMREQHVHRVLVIEKGELLGVLTTFDLLRAFVRDERSARTLRTVDRTA